MSYAASVLFRAGHLMESKSEVNESDNKVHLLCLTTLYQASQCKHMLCNRVP